MKACAACGAAIVGFERLCLPCRRADAAGQRVTKSVTESAPVTETVTPSPLPVTKSVTLPADVYRASALSSPPSGAVPGEPCPCCGRRVPLSLAERVRQSRARKRTAPHTAV